MQDETEEKTKRRGPRYEFLVAGLLFFIFSTYLSFGSVSSYFRQMKASQSFAPVSAIAVTAEVKEKGGSQTTHGASFYPEIVYRYSVQGKEYQSNRYFFSGNGWPDRASAQKVVERYLTNAQVQAYVNPNDPGEAVLDAGRPSAGTFLFLLPFWIFSFVVVYYGLRGRRDR